MFVTLFLLKKLCCLYLDLLVLKKNSNSINHRLKESKFLWRKFYNILSMTVRLHHKKHDCKIIKKLKNIKRLR